MKRQPRLYETATPAEQTGLLARTNMHPPNPRPSPFHLSLATLNPNIPARTGGRGSACVSQCFSCRPRDRSVVRS